MPTQTASQTETTIRTAFEAEVPAIAEMFASRIRRVYDDFSNDEGLVTSAMCRSALRAANRFGRSSYAEISPYLTTVPTEGYVIDPDQMLSVERVEKACHQAAEDQVAGFIAKTSQKIGELDNTEVLRVANCEFNITGDKDGARVQIVQRIVVNYTSAGRAYLQFPALIYVDGVKTSAKAYKTRFLA